MLIFSILIVLKKLKKEQFFFSFLFVFLLLLYSFLFQFFCCFHALSLLQTTFYPVLLVSNSKENNERP